jgi:phosphoribosylformylglycinamidine cyclo-ligase
VQGATPLFFLDYLATGRLSPQVMEAVVSGVARGCKENGCALLGGETAEMPGLYALGDYDLAGFIVGLVDDDAHQRAPVRAGDALVGLASNGLHTNGYSLARKVFEGSSLTRKVADQLLAPHTSYLEAMQDIPWKAAAHITGGGIPGNLPRVLPEGCRAIVRRRSWEVPPVFRALQAHGGIEDREMFRTFNMGIGYVLVAPPAHADRVMAALATAGQAVHVLGEIVSGERGVELSA